MSDTKTNEFERIIERLKEQYKPHNLFLIEDGRSGERYIARGSNWTEFSEIMKSPANRIPFELVRRLIVWPEIDAVDLDTNASGKWQPGRITALAEQIQEALGYTRSYTVKNV